MADVTDSILVKAKSVADEGGLVVVTGATAVGKTAFAIDLAEKIDAEILSCDALLVYKHMHIGTAKPTFEERRRVPHHGIDLIEPQSSFSVGDYVAYAKEIIENIHARGKAVVVVGGSGFYLKSFYRAVTDPDADVKPEVAAEVAQMDDATVLERLQVLNGGNLGHVDPRNVRRVRRALERCLSTHLTLDALSARLRALPSPFAAYQKYTVLLERDPEALNVRIEERVRLMLRLGLIDEVRALLQMGLHKVPASAIGYRETIDFLQKQTPAMEEELIQLIALHTRQLVHKQRTWFRNGLPIDLRFKV